MGVFRIAGCDERDLPLKPRPTAKTGITPNLMSNYPLDLHKALSKLGFDAIERGDFVTLHSEDELDGFLQDIQQEVSSELAADRR